MRTATRTVAELGRALLGAVYLVGAGVHVVLWATDRAVYGEFTTTILFDWYRELWTGLVLPNLGLLVPVLALFELLVGVAILLDDRYARPALVAGAGFNLAIAPLGFWWPSNLALAAIHLGLLRFEYSGTVLESVGWVGSDAS